MSPPPMDPLVAVWLRWDTAVAAWLQLLAWAAHYWAGHYWAGSVNKRSSFFTRSWRSSYQNIHRVALVQPFFTTH